MALRSSPLRQPPTSAAPSAAAVSAIARRRVAKRAGGATRVVFSDDARERIEDWTFSLANKLLGQVNVVRYGTRSVRPGGAITLTTGLAAQYPSPGSAIITTVNAAVEGFVRAVTAEPSISVRVNAVSPGWVSETLQAIGRDPAEGIPAAEVAEITVGQFREGATGWWRPPLRPETSFATRVASVRPGGGSAEPF